MYLIAANYMTCCLFNKVIVSTSFIDFCIRHDILMKITARKDKGNATQRYSFINSNRKPLLVLAIRTWVRLYVRTPKLYHVLRYTSNSSKMAYIIFSSFKYASILMYACSKEMCTSSNGPI